MPIRKIAPLPYPYEQLHGRCATLAERIASTYISHFVSEKNSLLEFDLKKVSRGVVTTEDLDAFLETCTAHLRQGKGNLVTPHLAVASDNNCRLIPEVHHFIHSVLATTWYSPCVDSMERELPHRDKLVIDTLDKMFGSLEPREKNFSSTLYQILCVRSDVLHTHEP